MDFHVSFASRVVGALLLFTVSGHAGPISEFEVALSSAYADYRAALFETNRKSKAGTEAALDGFAAKWRDLTARWSTNPPPHFTEDPDWRATLGKVAEIAAKARAQTVAGELAPAHDTLEALRDVIGAMRERNGQITFSDRMNSYHEKMEHVLQKAGEAPASAVLGELREDAAVLNYLAATLRQHRPASMKSDAAFETMLTEVETSVKELMAATRSGNAAATKAALQRLKPAYARLFLKYG